MAHPQLEDGWTEIANEILEALYRINLSPYESRVLWFIIRKTYGWHKKTDRIPLSQIAEGTGLLKPNICRALKSLIAHKLVIRTDKKQVGFQKDYEQWQVQKLSVPIIGEKVISSDNGVISSDNKRLSVPITKVISSDTLKRKKEKKETYQKKAPSAFEDYIKELKIEFSNLDVDEELKKFRLWWEGKSLKRPKLAFRNWLNKARQIKQKEAPNGKDRRHPEERYYTDPNSYRVPVILSTDPAILKLHEDLKGEKPHPTDG